MRSCFLSNSWLKLGRVFHMNSKEKYETTTTTIFMGIDREILDSCFEGSLSSVDAISIHFSRRELPVLSKTNRRDLPKPHLKTKTMD